MLTSIFKAVRLPKIVFWYRATLSCKLTVVSFNDFLSGVSKGHNSHKFSVLALLRDAMFYPYEITHSKDYDDWWRSGNATDKHVERIHTSSLWIEHIDSTDKIIA